VFTIQKGSIYLCGFQSVVDKTNFEKPLWCHIFPLGIVNKDGVTYITFDWVMNSKICLGKQRVIDYGKELNSKAFHAAQGALKRKFGEDFYKKMEEYHAKNY
jgi:hypothetical protein